VAEFETPPQVRWEELMVRFNKYPNKEAAQNAIVEMGNQVFHGAPLADVAKKGSDGITAKDGGLRDWTSKGSLVSESLDRTLFGLPIGQLSQIIETEQGYHIIRVRDRKDTVRTPFVEAQVSIRNKLKDQKTKEQLQEFLAKIEKVTTVTYFMDGAPRQASTAQALPYR
jgi:parvulin-like peptidyl-prolyl isomerase